jgi:excisionase family DNA binding protein
MKLLTTQQAADLLGINLNNISLRCRQGKIPGAVQIGGRWLIPEESLEKIRAYPEKKNKRYSPS